ncbi:MAG: hypothetical protein NCW75_09465 [Phycisphaera sp.]|nr:MAG: hypothetical protein NCW75_09465 [Phycisphaera sp.]
MRQQETLAILTTVGLSASVALAGPADVSDLVGPEIQPSNTGAAWLTYIGSYAGPSNVAQSVDGPAFADEGMSSMLFLTLAGPGNIATGSPVIFDLSAGGFGDGPATPGVLSKATPTTPDLIGSLQPDEQPGVVTRPGSGQAEETDPGGFQVVVPLPGAGALAAGGLAFVALRRRR